ncbi:MAG: glycosyltransferase [Chloroflexaceae bacterium]|jgi:glycosyltransferase involved in cell wall biosynthesis|nr:glycosyltransferase [Chloroflexaceae bacterium]
MQLSVILPCLNSRATIITQLEALAQQEWDKPWELIVADNGSTDGTPAIVQAYRNRIPNLRLVDAAAQRGAAYARNVGAQHARAEALAFCDADDEVGPGWVAAMGEALRTHAFVVSQISLERLNPPWMSQVWQPSHRGPRSHLGFLPAAASFGIGIWQSTHQQLGGFDASLPRLHDIDYSWRAQLAGATLHFVPEAVVYYRCRRRLHATFHQARQDGIDRVALYKRYKAYGMPWEYWKISLCRWGQLLRRLYHVRSRAELMGWLVDAGYRVGYMEGSLRFHIIAI